MLSLLLCSLNDREQVSAPQEGLACLHNDEPCRVQPLWFNKATHRRKPLEKPPCGGTSGTGIEPGRTFQAVEGAHELEEGGALEVVVQPDGRSVCAKRESDTHVSRNSQRPYVVAWDTKETNDAFTTYYFSTWFELSSLQTGLYFYRDDLDMSTNVDTITREEKWLSADGITVTRRSRKWFYSSSCTIS